MRLQGFEPGGPTNQWVGYSQFLPGGGAGPDSTPFEKVYVVLRRRDDRHRRREGDGLRRDGFLHDRPGEVRELVNRTNDVCKMLVVIPYPPGVNP